MLVKMLNISAVPMQTLSIRCPGCRQRATLEPVGASDFSSHDGILLGQRRCPNPDCKTHVFVVYRNGEILATHPSERIEFDTANIPAGVLRCLDEAVTCHSAQCFTAAAIMVRKSLEELCRDRGAEGPNLKQRIRTLRDRVILPPELFEGLDDLRLLGNDAAHIESQEFNQIGQEEVELGLEFAKEVLKSVYQYSALLNRLRALKRS